MQTEWPRYFQLLFIFHFPSTVACSHFDFFLVSPTTDVAFWIFFLISIAQQNKNNKSELSIWNCHQTFVLRCSLSNKQAEGQDKAVECQARLLTLSPSCLKRVLPEKLLGKWDCFKSGCQNGQDILSHEKSFHIGFLWFQRFCFQKPRQTLPKWSISRWAKRMWMSVDMLLSTLQALANHIFALWEQRIIQMLWLCL